MTQHLTLAHLQEEVSELRAECRMLAERQSWLERIFQAYGISGLWVSPQQAAELLCVGREGLIQHIRRAERFRQADIDCECKYGIHYRQVPRCKDEVSDRPTWQIHVGNFEKLISIPQDKLKAG